MSVVSAIYHAQRAVIRGNVSTAVLEIEVETLCSSGRAPPLGMSRSAEQTLNINCLFVPLMQTD